MSRKWAERCLLDAIFLTIARFVSVVSSFQASLIDRTACSRGGEKAK